MHRQTSIPSAAPTRLERVVTAACLFATAALGGWLAVVVLGRWFA